jgi:hypothetical protein
VQTESDFGFILAVLSDAKRLVCTDVSDNSAASVFSVKE